MDKFETVYTEKLGLFNNKKNYISLHLQEDEIIGRAFKSSTDLGYTHQALNCKYSEIQNYGISFF